MAIKDDLEEIAVYIQSGQDLAERYRPCDAQDLEKPAEDIAIISMFTSWRTRAMRFVMLQTGANSEYAQAFSRNCSAAGSYGDVIAGLTELEKVKQGIMDGRFKRRGVSYTA